MKNTFHSRLLPLGVSWALLTGALAGCGGSGGGSAALRPAAVTLNGTLLSSAGAPMPGYEVVYTPGGAQPQARLPAHAVTMLSTVTDSLGHYTLVIPAAQITGHDVLAFYDTTGAFAQTQNVTLDTTQAGTVTVPQNVITTLPAPPAPPVTLA